MRRKLAIWTLLLASPVFGADVTIDAASGTSLQAAIDAIPADRAEWTRILLKPGTYTQQLSVTRPKVAVIGLGSKPDDVIITYNLSARSPKRDGSAGEVGTSGSSSTFVLAADFVASNVTFANSTADNVAQAVAIKTQSDRCIFTNCRFVGFQDTLYPTRGRCYFRECYITGDTDFIFGDATVVFDRCTINSSDRQYITAANTPPDNKYGFVFVNCTLTAADGVQPGTIYLGRPWQWDRNKNAAVTFIHTTMGPHIHPAGWHPWNVEKNTNPGANARYAEFGSVDPAGKPVDVSRRVPWSRQLSESEAAEYTVKNVLSGSDNWSPDAVIDSVLNKEGSAK